MSKIAVVHYPLWPNHDPYSPVSLACTMSGRAVGIAVIIIMCGTPCTIPPNHTAPRVRYVLNYAIRPTFLLHTRGDGVPEEKPPGDPLVILTWTTGAISLPCHAEEVSRKDG
jgi:hypothetical protein